MAGSKTASGTAQPDEVSVPVACSLTTSQLADRVAAWNDSLGYMMSRSETPDGVRLVFQDRPGLAERLATLAQLEHECCPWMELSVSEAPPTLTVAAAGAGIEAARRMFAGGEG